MPKFLINNIIYNIDEKVCAKSKTFTFLIEQSDRDKIDNVIPIKLPEKITKHSNIDQHIKTSLEILQNSHKTSTIKSVKMADIYIEILKYFGYKNIKKVKNDFKDSILSTLSKKQYNNDFLIELLGTSYSECLTCVNQKDIVIDVKDLVMKYINKSINEDVFNKMLNYDCDNNDNRAKFMDISGLITEKDKIKCVNLDIKNIQGKIFEYSYNMLDDNFMEWLEVQDNIFIAGGLLEGCITNEIMPWSDIDIWLFNKKDVDLYDSLMVLCKKLESTFSSYFCKYQDFIWSTHKNVVTFYCNNYKRNIQIIIVNDQPTESVGTFDMDYIRAYLYMGKVYGTSQFLRSMINQKIYDVTDETSHHRFVKAYLKGYSFDENITKKHPIVKAIIHKYDKDYKIEEEYKEIINPKIDEMILQVTNKFYYPNNEDNDTNIVDNKKLYNCTRAEFMIKKILGHKNVFFTSKELIIYLKKNGIYPENEIQHFTTKYDIVENYAEHNGNNDNDRDDRGDNNGDDDNTDNKYDKFFDKNKKIDTKIRIIKTNQNIDLKKMMVEINKSCDYVNHNNRSSIIPVRIKNNNCINRFYFETIVNLRWYPFQRFNKNYGKTEYDPSLYNIKIWKSDDENVKELYKFIGEIDSYYNNLIRGGQLRTKKGKKIDHYNAMIYIKSNKEVDDADDDDPRDDTYTKNKEFDTYIKFKLWIDNEIVKTKFFKNGKPLDIVKTTDLPELRRYIMIDSKIKLLICFDSLFLSSNAGGRGNCIFPRCYIMRIDIYE